MQFGILSKYLIRMFFVIHSGSSSWRSYTHLRIPQRSTQKPLEGKQRCSDKEGSRSIMHHGIHYQRQIQSAVASRRQIHGTQHTSNIKPDWAMREKRRIPIEVHDVHTKVGWGLWIQKATSELHETYKKRRQRSYHCKSSKSIRFINGTSYRFFCNQRLVRNTMHNWKNYWRDQKKAPTFTTLTKSIHHFMRTYRSIREWYVVAFCRCCAEHSDT